MSPVPHPQKVEYCTIVSALSVPLHKPLNLTQININYSSAIIGARFSNALLHSLLTMLKDPATVETINTMFAVKVSHSLNLDTTGSATAGGFARNLAFSLFGCAASMGVALGAGAGLLGGRRPAGDILQLQEAGGAGAIGWWGRVGM